MSNPTETSEPVQEPGQPEVEVEAPQGTDTEPEGKETDWKAQSRKWERLAKENKAAAEKLAELEESQKTEDQKRAERLAELESEIAAYRTKEQIAEWAKDVADETGVPASALRGSTREELEAHAKELQSLISKKPKPTSPALARANQGDGPQVTTSPGLGTLKAAYAESN